LGSAPWQPSQSPLTSQDALGPNKEHQDEDGKGDGIVETRGDLGRAQTFGHSQEQAPQDASRDVAYPLPVARSSTATKAAHM
jgi:hypothetical protein